MSDAVSRVREYLLGLQQRIVSALEAEDGQGQFIRDEWKKPPGEKLQGEGVTRLMEEGVLLERGGVGFSHVRGPALPPSGVVGRDYASFSIAQRDLVIELLLAGRFHLALAAVLLQRRERQPHARFVVAGAAREHVGERALRLRGLVSAQPEIALGELSLQRHVLAHELGRPHRRATVPP